MNVIEASRSSREPFYKSRLCYCSSWGALLNVFVCNYLIYVACEPWCRHMNIPGYEGSKNPLCRACSDLCMCIIHPPAQSLQLVCQCVSCNVKRGGEKYEEAT
jgi:hypothetical protein